MTARCRGARGWMAAAHVASDTDVPGQSTQLTVGQNSSEWPRLQVDIPGGMCCLLCRSFGEVAIVGEATETADDQRFLELWTIYQC